MFVNHDYLNLHFRKLPKFGLKPNYLFFLIIKFK